MDGLLWLGVMVLASVMGALYIAALWLGSAKYGVMLSAVKGATRAFLPAGLGLLDMFRYRYNSSYARQALQNCRILHGEKYAQFYLRVNMAQKISIGGLILLAGFALAAATREALMLALAVGMAGGIAYYFETTITDEIHRRRDSIRRDFPEVLSKLALLVNAGMIVNEAWERVGNTGAGVLYDEMRATVVEMQNGTSDYDAFLSFSQRCGSDDVTKFVSTLLQNMSKGNREVVEMLKQFAGESWNERRQTARRKGTEAASKLLIPILVMFLGILVMVVVPIFLNISV